MSIDYKVIGKRIQKQRKVKGITQEQLAEILNLSVMSVSNIENARTRVSLETAVEVANVLECTVDHWLEGFQKTESYAGHDHFAILLFDCTAWEKVVLYRAIKAIKGILRNTSIHNSRFPNDCE